MRNRVERFFRYLKERTTVFHRKMSAGNHIQGIKNLKLFLNLFTLYYQAASQEVGEKAYPDISSERTTVWERRMRMV
jgi:hypothetical protein